MSALAEINLEAARKALDASVERLARLAAEQDATRMRTVGERSREQRRAIAGMVQPHEAPFVRMGLRVGFVDRLRVAVDWVGR